MIAPPERKPSVKTDRRDAERIVREDMLGYTRRCYIPSPYIEELRNMVVQQVQAGRKSSRTMRTRTYLAFGLSSICHLDPRLSLSLRLYGC